MNKVHLLADLVRAYKLDGIAVLETWLLDTDPSGMVHLPGFSITRCDVVGKKRKHGVCLYMRDSLTIVEEPLNCPNAICVYLSCMDVRILVAYRAPSNTDMENDSLRATIQDKCNDKDTLLLGDFNLPTLDWESGTPCSGYVSPLDRDFMECFDSLGLTQWVREPTFIISGNVLDLVFTTDPERIGDVSVLAPFPRCGHTPVVFSYVSELHLTRQVRADRSILWYKGAYGTISDSLSHWDWEFEFTNTSVQSDYDLLCGVLADLIDRYIPVRTHKSAPWQSRPPARMMRQRSDAWNHYKQTRASYGRRDQRSATALVTFNQINHQYRNYHLANRSEYEWELASQIKTAPKLFHAYVRHKKVGRPTVGPLKTDDGRIVEDSYAMSEMFATAFASVFNVDVPLYPTRAYLVGERMDDVQITHEEVDLILTSLDHQSSMGPDGIHPMILKTCHAQLSYPLHLIFKKSLATSTLPKQWTSSQVVPIYKNKSRFDPLNYRPVSLTSVCCKSLERIIVSHLMHYLEQNNILSQNQFGFRRGRSTEDQLLLTYGEIVRWYDMGLVVDSLLLDFSKAFDVICHVVLLQHLRDVGVATSLICWIEAFLSGRTMRVSCGGAVSQPRDVRSGVPQGSVLGPVLFLIYINSLIDGISCSFKAFADDYKLYLQYPRDRALSIIENVTRLQADLNHLNIVAKSWNLKLNPSKCVVIRFCRGNFDWEPLGDRAAYKLDGEPVKIVKIHKHLGIWVDCNLKFHQHIHTVVNKAAGLAGNLLRSTVNRSPQFMLTLFVSHIRPILEYGCSVWNLGYLGDSRMLEGVQRRWTRAIDGLSTLSYHDRLKALDLFSLKGRRLRHDLIKFWSVFRDHEGDNGLLELFERAPLVGTRGHKFKLRVPRCSTDVASRFFVARTVRIWNGLPSDVVDKTGLSSFKAALALHLGETFFEYD